MLHFLNDRHKRRWHPLVLHFHFSLSFIGEGNGNPLQCSSLENPRDGRAWWAAVYGVAQSRTGLKWLSSSSSSSTYHSIRDSSVGSSFVSVAERFMIFFFPPARTVLVCMTLQIFFLSNNYSFISVVSIVVEITGRGGNKPESFS